MNQPQKAAVQPPAANEFVISRTFDAPRTRMWKAWTELHALEKWWGPKGFALTNCRLDLKPDGLFVYCMETRGQKMWGRFRFTEITAPSRLAYVNSFSDENGGITRAPFFDGKWPLETMNIVTFEETDGKTTVTLRGYPINANETEMQAYVDNFKGMQAGFTGTLDQLDTYLVETA
jgi:uncharacterized protein YndB with AHSA1/START domain